MAEAQKNKKCGIFVAGDKYHGYLSKGCGKKLLL